MKYGDKTNIGFYYKKSLTKKLKSEITNELIRENISAIWLEHNEEDDNDYIIIYFKEDQDKIWNVYDEIPMTSTQVPNYDIADSTRLNDWLNEIAYVKE